MKVIQSQAKPSSRISNKTKEPGQIHCLITGFDAFGGSNDNPSQTIVESLPKSIKLRKSKVTLDLHSLVLPSCGDNSWRILRRALDAVPVTQPVCIVLTGVAAHRGSISIERFALNIRDYRIKDNCGEEWHGDRIAENGPEAFRTDVDVEFLTQRLRKKGLPTDISNHCGTFVCNEIYYRALLACQQAGRKHKSVFVHIPSPTLFGTKLREQGNEAFEGRTRGRTNQIAILRNAVLDIASVLAEELLAEQTENYIKA
jgi:pyroglutamyl-peptidase